MNDELKKLPEGWEWKKLGEVCKLKNGYAFKSSDYISEGIPVVRISDIKEGKVNTNDSIRVKYQKELEEYLINKGDILIAMSGATTGKFGICNSNEKAYQNQRVGNFQIRDKKILYNSFLHYLLSTIKRTVEKTAYGGAQPNISSKKIENIDIPLPPLPIQNKIVEKIEELFSEFDSGVEELKKVKKQLKTYRQAVLHAAFTGKLTEEWRVNKSLRDPNEIVKSIKNNSDDKNSQKELSLKSINFANQISKQIPKEWIITTLENVTIKIGDVDHKMPKEVKSGIPYISTKNFYGTNDIDFEGSKKISSQDYLNLKKKIFPESNDFLISRYGTVGEIRKINLNIKFQASYSIAIIKTYKDNITLIDYLDFCLRSNIIQKQIREHIRATTQENIGLEQIKELIVPLPSHEEQQKIVEEIETRLSVCDKIEETIETTLAQSESLRQSILKKAFEGKLI